METTPATAGWKRLALPAWVAAGALAIGVVYTSYGGAGSASVRPAALLPGGGAPPHPELAAASVAVRTPGREELASAGAAAESSDDPPATPAGPATGERGHYGELLAAAAEDAEGLLGRAREELEGDGDDPRKVALLRVLYETDPARAGELFALAIRALPDRSTAHASSVPDFALRYLGERAGADPAARAVLRGVAFGPEKASRAALRRRAVMYLARTSTGAELLELAPEVRAERDELLRAGFAAGLLQNDKERDVELLYADLLMARAKLAGDEDRHEGNESP